MAEPQNIPILRMSFSSPSVPPPQPGVRLPDLRGTLVRTRLSQQDIGNLSSAPAERASITRSQISVAKDSLSSRQAVDHSPAQPLEQLV